MRMYTYIPTYLHAYIHYIRTYIHACMHTYIHMVACVCVFCACACLHSEAVQQLWRDSQVDFRVYVCLTPHSSWSSISRNPTDIWSSPPALLVLVGKFLEDGRLLARCCSKSSVVTNTQSMKMRTAGERPWQDFTGNRQTSAGDVHRPGRKHMEPTYYMPETLLPGVCILNHLLSPGCHHKSC